MRYVKHDIYYNLTSAVKAKDENAVRNILNDEITEIISNSPVRLITTMQQCGISIGNKPSNREIVNKVVIGVNKNERFKNILSDMIAEKNKQTKVNSSATGEGGKPVHNTQVFTSALNSYFIGSDGKKSNVSGDAESNQPTSEELKKGLIDTLALKGQSVGLAGGKGIKVVAIVAIAIGLIYIVDKFKNKM